MIVYVGSLQADQGDRFAADFNVLNFCLGLEHVLNELERLCRVKYGEFGLELAHLD